MNALTITGGWIHWSLQKDMKFSLEEQRYEDPEHRCHELLVVDVALNSQTYVRIQ
jgi:hypothetical protein